MSAMLRIAGDGGTCCACGDVDGCDCRKCSKLECRSRGGEVKLCGWPEYPGHESTPPRFYLKKQLGGMAVVCTCPPGGCDNIDLSTPLSCEIDLVAPNGYRYYGKGEITNIYIDGAMKADVQVTFSGGGPLGGPATAYYTGNGLFYFGGYGSGSKLGAQAVSGSACSGGASTGFNSVTINMDIPGVSGTVSCSATRTVRLDSVVASKIVSYSGEQTYDPAVSCDVLTLNTATRTTTECTGLLCRSSHASCSGETIEQPVSSAFELGDVFLDSYLSPKTVTATDIIQAGPVACGDGRTMAAQSGSQRWEQLQEEDTDEDALARLLAGPGGVWSPWQIVHDGKGETCENPECCRAAWEIRTDRTYEYREAEWRATIEGLAPGTDVTIKIKVYRRAYGQLTWAEFEDHEYDRTADGEGKAQVTGVTPNAEGFETYVGCSYNAPEAP